MTRSTHLQQHSQQGLAVIFTVGESAILLTSCVKVLHDIKVGCHIGPENDKLRDFTNPTPLRAVCDSATEPQVEAASIWSRTPRGSTNFGKRTSSWENPANMSLPSAVAVASVLAACMVSSGEISPNSVNRADRVFT